MSDSTLKRYFSTESHGERSRTMDKQRYRTYFDFAQYDWFEPFLKWNHVFNLNERPI